MNSTTILGILGVIATVSFGIWGIYVTIKRKYSGQITFVKENYIGLFDSIVKNLPDLSVLYKNKPVMQSLVLLKASLLNTGNKDITNSMVTGKITIYLPDDYKWHAAKIVSTSQNVKADITLDKNKLYFDTGLFRCKEFIRFEALAEVPIKENNDLSKNISIVEQLSRDLEMSHRIADTQKIKIIELPDTELQNTKKQLKSLLFFPLLFLILPLYFFTLDYFGLGNYKLNYILSTETENNIEIAIKPKSDGTIVVKGVDNIYEENITLDEFF